jgi:hypothetical protein
VKAQGYRIDEIIVSTNGWGFSSIDVIALRIAAACFHLEVQAVTSVRLEQKRAIDLAKVSNYPVPSKTTPPLVQAVPLGMCNTQIQYYQHIRDHIVSIAFFDHETELFHSAHP